MTPEIAAVMAGNASAEQRAHVASALAFCQALSRHSAATLAEAADLFCLLSPNVQHLVHSPQGWATLGKLMTNGESAPALATVH